MGRLSETPKQACLLVLGMHRSGTSAITGSLARAGFALGSELLEPGQDNPKGYFEHAEAVRINDALLDGLDRRWDDIRPLPEGWERSSVAETARFAISTLLTKDFEAPSLIAIKDPRMCRLLPVWLDALRARNIAVNALIVARSPGAVSASIAKRNGWPAAVADTLWLGHMLDAERDSRGLARSVVTYDAFLEAPQSVLATALEKLGLTEAAEAMRRTNLDKFVSKRDRHHRGERQADEAGDISVLADETYAVIEQAASGGELDLHVFDKLRERLRMLLAPASAHIEGLAQVALAFRRNCEQVEANLAVVRSDLLAQQDWAVQAMEQREALHAALAAVRSDLIAQKNWSKQAVEQREALHVELAAARSDLLAQQEWSKQAVKQQEALHAELATVRSDLLAQQEWSKQAVEHQEALHAELATVRSDLLAQLEWSKQAVEQREALHAELAAVRSDLLAQMDWSDQAVKQREALQAELASARADLSDHIQKLRGGEIAMKDLQAELATTQSGLVKMQYALRDAERQRDLLQSHVARHEATWLGQFNRWYLKIRQPASSIKDDE